MDVMKNNSNPDHLKASLYECIITKNEPKLTIAYYVKLREAQSYHLVLGIFLKVSYSIPSLEDRKILIFLGPRH